MWVEGSPDPDKAASRGGMATTVRVRQVVASARVVAARTACPGRRHRRIPLAGRPSPGATTLHSPTRIPEARALSWHPRSPGESTESTAYVWAPSGDQPPEPGWTSWAEPCQALSLTGCSSTRRISSNAVLTVLASTHSVSGKRALTGPRPRPSLQGRWSSKRPRAQGIHMYTHTRCRRPAICLKAARPSFHFDFNRADEGREHMHWAGLAALTLGGSRYGC